MKRIFFFVVFALLVACEGVRDAGGYVVDATTNEKLDSVVVKSFIGHSHGRLSMEMMTDSTGVYKGSTGLVGCGLGDCPDLIVEFAKKGYETQEFVNPEKLTVYMIRE